MKINLKLLNEMVAKEYENSLLDEKVKAETSERQERGFIEAVNKYASKENPITIKAGRSEVQGVVGANKVSGCNKFGCEMYADIVLYKSDGKDIKISAKGTSAPSIAGGGLLGAKALTGKLIPNFLEAAEKWYLQNGFKSGEIIPDIYGKVNDEDKLRAIIGSEEVGGPIDLMYLGPMDVQHQYNEANKTLILNGNLEPANVYAKDHDIYVRLRKRREDQPFVPGEKDQHGFPLILGRSPSRGDIGRRIVFVTGVPKNRAVVEF